VASTVGGGFGALLVALGILSVFAGSVLGGVWFALIGLFVRGAALGGYRQLVLRQVLEGEPAARFADKSITPVSPWLSIQELVEGHVYRGRAHAYPVAENGRLLGMITTSDLRSVPRDRWHDMRVRDLMDAPSSENSITPDVDAMTAFRKMTSSGRPRLMVTDRDGLIGILTLKDLLEVAEIMLEMEGAK
jgi:CBS domain-containing protein